MASESYAPGLEGVIAGETAVSTIDGGLAYRGYAIEQLAEHATFPEVAWLLLHGELPTHEQLADFQSILHESAVVPQAVVELLGKIPAGVSAIDTLRTGISAAANFDAADAGQAASLPSDAGSLAHDGDVQANLRKSTRLLAQIPSLIAVRYRQSHGRSPVEHNPELSFAANVLTMITGRQPSQLEERAMDVSLILYAEHEFNASTFTARIVTSTGSDLYSAVTAAVGALKGPLHGGANERVMAILNDVGTPERAEAWVREALARKQRVMGFGHRVYKSGDPRAVILRDYCRQLAQARGRMDLEDIADTIENVIHGEKGLPPNLDWPSARLYHYLGLDVELYTPLFVASRVAGWSAHVIEQSQNNRLIRPRSHYTGPRRRNYSSLNQRG